MPSFSQSSYQRLKSCHPDLQKLFMRVVENYDCTIIEGYRNEEDQNAAFKAGKSKLQYPHGKHNQNPSLAVDVAPYPIDWSDLPRFYHFGGYVLAKAEELGITIRWGGDWDQDLSFSDQLFDDLVHFELVE